MAGRAFVAAKISDVNNANKLILNIFNVPWDDRPAVE